MPVSYACDHCHTTAPSLAGWFIVSVNFLHEDPNASTPPGGRVLDATAADLLFDTAACRDAWCAAAGLAAPAQTAPANA
jgi:hypothetical protein